MTVGVVVSLVSKTITDAKIVAFPELGMEAIHESEVKDMLVIVAVDTQGEAVHQTGPAKWKSLIGEKVEVN